jgi:hypothetical protein
MINLKTARITTLNDKKNRYYSPQGVPWNTAATAERPCCPAVRAERRTPPPPRPAPRLHAAEKQKVKIKINYQLSEGISHIKVQIFKHLLPSAWDARAVLCWDHRMMVEKQTPRCQTPRLQEPRPQESHRWKSLQQPRWTAATPQPQGLWKRRCPPQQPQPPGWR